MKIIQLVFGVPLAIFGLVMVGGTILSLQDGSSEFTLAEDLIFSFLLGILPLLGGLYLCRLATKKNTNENLES